MPIPSTLSSGFYLRDTETVARELLGKKLVRLYQGQRISGIITEVEAYLGISDRACHTFQGRRTPRTEMMYARGGLAYLYLIYGMYLCLNAVTREQGVPEAVLIRSLEPDEGIDWMKKFRKSEELKNLTTGPGKLAQALHLHREMNGISLQSSELFIENASVIPHERVVACPRIGVDYAGEHAHWPLRFYVRDNAFLSKK